MRKRDKAFRPDRVGDYFRVEWLPLGLVTVSGLVYNVGLLAAPWPPWSAPASTTRSIRRWWCC